MDVDLGLDQGNRYSVALVVFFIPYLLFEVTILLRQHVFCGFELTVPSIAALESGVASSRRSELVGIHRLCLGYGHVRPGMDISGPHFLPIILSFS